MQAFNLRMIAIKNFDRLRRKLEIKGEYGFHKSIFRMFIHFLVSMTLVVKKLGIEPYWSFD